MPATLWVAIALAQATTYTPQSTRVVIIRTLNLSGDKYEKMKALQVEEADSTMRKLFEDRGFTVAPAEEAAAAVKTVGVDLTDEENQKKDVLYKIGETANAKLVVFVVIDRTWQKSTEGVFMNKLEGFAATRTWVLDVPEKKAILSAAKTEGKSAKNGPTGSERQVRAVRLGLESQMKDFFKPYPTLKK